MTKKLVLLALLVFCFCMVPSAHAQATAVYLAQSAVGAGNGLDCADARAVSYFNSSGNWGTGSTQIGPGTTVHLCGSSITTALTFQGSGSAGGSSVCGSLATACTPIVLDGTNLTGMNASIFLGAKNYLTIQHITWASNNANGNHVMDLEGASHINILNNNEDSFEANTTDSDIIWIGAAQGFSTDIDIKGNVFGYAPVITGFQSDIIATERSSFVTIEDNILTNRSPNSCGSCHDDLMQTFCGNSCSSNQPPHDWTVRWNLLIMNTTYNINKSCGIFEGMNGPLNIYGNLYEGLQGGSGANCVVADSNVAGFVFNYYKNTLVEKAGGPNNLLNLSGTGTYNIKDNIIYNTDAGNAFTGGATLNRTGNVWFGPNIPSCSGTSDICGQNPLFTNYSSNDFSLQSGSPAHNFATNLSSVFTQYVLPEATWPNPTLGTLPGGSTNWDAGYTQLTQIASVTLSPSTEAFGSVNVGSASSPVTFTLSNTTASSATGITVTFTGGNSGDFVNTGTGTCGSSLGASASCTIIVTFNPSVAGSRSTTLNVADSASSSPQQSSLSGTGVSGSVTISPSSENFGSVNVGSSSSNVTFTLSNASGSTVTGITPTFTGGNTGDFSNTGTGTCGSSLSNSSSCTIIVKFSPTATGSRTTTLNVADSAASSPQQSSLSGTGATPPTSVTLSPTSQSFGSSFVGVAATTQTFTLSNTGATTVTGITITFVTGNTGDFSNTGGTCGSTLAGSSSCTIIVTFTPSASGSRTTTLNVADSATGSPQQSSLTGTGVTQGVSISPTSIAFGNQLVNTASVGQVVTLTNNTASSLTLGSITYTGTNSSDFSTSATTCTGTLASKGTCTVTVIFTPTQTPITNESGSVSIAYTGFAGSPLTASLTGTSANGTPPLPPTALTVTNVQ